MNTTPSLSPPSAPGNLRTDPADWLSLYGDYLFNFAVGQIRNPTEAEDLVQETFLAALKSRDRFAGHCSERTWLVSILRHKICDHLRAKSRHPQVDLAGTDADGNATDVDEALVWLHESAAQCLTPDRNMDLADFRVALETALGQLPARLAQAFQMYELEDQSGRDVCAALNISESNLWVMLHRARTQLRKTLAPRWGAEKE
jgi:RNA polymerase sigma-70 factor (TIGR02943 family)